MNVLIVILTGLLVGAMADSIASGRGPGKKADIGIAIVGAFIATLIYMNMREVGHTAFGSVSASLVGAAALVSPFIVFITGRGPKRI